MLAHMNISSAPRLRVAAVALVAVLGLAVSVGGASATTTSVRSGAHGTASVAYAGSLELWAATDLGPKFEAATGDDFQGVASNKEIDGGVVRLVANKPSGDL